LLLRGHITLLERRSTARPKLSWTDRVLIAWLLAVIPRPTSPGCACRPHPRLLEYTILGWNVSIFRTRRRAGIQAGRDVQEHHPQRFGLGHPGECTDAVYTNPAWPGTTS
jgi:hypothetical protein